MRNEGKLVEWNSHFENLYGSTYESIATAINGDFDRITSLEVLGAEKLQGMYPDDVTTIFISPPSLEEARRRRETRPDETPAQEKERDDRAVMEMEHAGNFRYALVNDDLEAAVVNVAAIIRAERCARFVRDITQMGLLNLLALHRSEMNHA
jgi:guanylate kinase